jgi:hypothetical protein
MVKRQKEKQYQSAKEQRASGKNRAGTLINPSTGQVQKILPFNCCALSLVPYKDPVCTILESSGEDNTYKYGIIFDNACKIFASRSLLCST